MNLFTNISTAPFRHSAPAGANAQFVPCAEDLLTVESQSKFATSLPAATMET